MNTRIHLSRPVPRRRGLALSLGVAPAVTAALCVWALLAAWAAGAERAARGTERPGDGANLVADTSRPAGTIRPLNGVNDGPTPAGGMVDLSAYYRELHIPLVRLHDCHWPCGDVVDMHTVFPNPQADPAKPSSYDFARTDAYVGAIERCGCGIVYRLGESIEHTKRKYHVHPPADDQRWADACCGIIRHYNEGWAGGFHYHIRYWEIWNEPDNRPDMWTGNDEQFFSLYAAAARTIKAKFPSLCVGGPGVGGTGDLTAGRLTPSPFLAAFLRRCRRDHLPLDFFSWHIYTDDPRQVFQRARAIRRLLDRSGFTKTQSFLDEWNYLPGNDWSPMLPGHQGLVRQRWYDQMAGPKGAAFVAAVLIGLQDCPVDEANFYRGNTGDFGLFNFYGVPNKVYYAMKAFADLRETPRRVRLAGHLPDHLAACAGTDKNRTHLTVLISNYSSHDWQGTISLRGMAWQVGRQAAANPTPGGSKRVAQSPTAQCRTLLLDAEHNLEAGRVQPLAGPSPRLHVQVKAQTVVLLEVGPSQPKPR